MFASAESLQFQMNSIWRLATILALTTLHSIHSVKTQSLLVCSFMVDEVTIHATKVTIKKEKHNPEQVTVIKFQQNGRLNDREWVEYTVSISYFHT